MGCSHFSSLGLYYYNVNELNATECKLKKKKNGKFCFLYLKRWLDSTTFDGGKEKKKE